MRIVQNKTSKEPCHICGELFNGGELKVAELIMSGPYNKFKKTQFYHKECLKKKYEKDIDLIEKKWVEKSIELGLNIT